MVQQLNPQISVSRFGFLRRVISLARNLAVRRLPRPEGHRVANPGADVFTAATISQEVNELLSNLLGLHPGRRKIRGRITAKQAPQHRRRIGK